MTENMDNKTLGARIYNARNALGLSRRELATQIGVKKRTVEDWENNHKMPRANHLHMLAGIFNVSIIWLLSGESNGTTNVADGMNRSSLAIHSLNEIRALQSSLREALTRLSALEERIVNEDFTN